MAKRKKRMKMQDIRRNAIVYMLNADCTRNIRPQDEIVLWCMRKEYKRGEHQGALNPYC